MLTLRQYIDSERREVASAYDTTMAEIEWAYPDSIYAEDYRRYVVACIAAEDYPTRRVWNTLPPAFRADIARDHTIRTNDGAARWYTDMQAR